MDTQVSDTLDRLELMGRVRLALDGLMTIDRYAWDSRGVLTMAGKLHAPADKIYPQIRAGMEALGFTPFLRKSGNDVEIMALPFVVSASKPNVVVPVVLFIITILSTLAVGALYDGVNVFSNPAGIVAGIPFSATIMGILFVHEMGHYIVGRWRRAPVSLPYFIPVPPIPIPGLGVVTFTGTLGAVIVQREPMLDRKTILEIGIAGPLAGLVVAIPLLLYGLATLPVGPPPAEGYIQEGNSILYAAAKYLVFGRFLPGNGVDVQLNAVAWGAWIGLLVTMINLLPIGQLDGGHVAYALLGEYAHYLAYAFIGGCMLIGILVAPNWLLWGMLGLLIGPRHPPPLNDVSRIGPLHTALAILGLIVFVLLFMPNPLQFVAGG
ncbi:MAG: site-2 protease family protein [Roseiflexaceae bacterium]|nr:site-2 protease family protein [Roseiflexaceae bacterium]